MNSEKIGERLKIAFNYLKKKGKVRYQRDLARLMDVNEVTVSRALSGVESYCNKQFLLNFNATFDNIFSLPWLEGEDVPMLADPDNPLSADEKIGDLTKEIHELRSLLVQELEEIKILKVELRATIAILSAQKSSPYAVFKTQQKTPPYSIPRTQVPHTPDVDKLIDDILHSCNVADATPNPYTSQKEKSLTPKNK